MVVPNTHPMKPFARVLTLLAMSIVPALADELPNRTIPPAGPDYGYRIAVGLAQGVGFYAFYPTSEKPRGEGFFDFLEGIDLDLRKRLSRHLGLETGIQYGYAPTETAYVGKIWVRTMIHFRNAVIDPGIGYAYLYYPSHTYWEPYSPDMLHDNEMHALYVSPGASFSFGPRRQFGVHARLELQVNEFPGMMAVSAGISYAFPSIGG